MEADGKGHDPEVKESLGPGKLGLLLFLLY
jgi:hypothetical protein